VSLPWGSGTLPPLGSWNAFCRSLKPQSLGWSGPRIEYPEARARIYYVSPGVIMIGGDGEPVPAELSRLSAVSIA
jgi:hypothetical protein